MSLDPSAITPATPLYLVIGGQPQGPYTLQQINEGLAGMEITPETLVCPNGGSAWTPLREFPASRYSGPVFAAPVPAPAAVVVGTPLVLRQGPTRRAEVQRKDQTRWWEVVLLAGALLSLACPWLVSGIDGKFTQTGIQTVMGGVTLGDATDETAGRLVAAVREAGPDASGLVQLAVVAAAAAMVVTLTGRWRRTAGVLSFAAAGLIALQGYRGFPFEHAVAEALQSGTALPAARPLPTGSVMDAGFQRKDREIQMLYSVLDYKTHCGLWYYVVLAALVLSGLMALLAPRRHSGR